MNVQCEKCGTGYDLDETLVGPSGTTVRCTVCSHVFKVHAPRGSKVETWILRQASGATFPFDRLGILQDWIAEGKVSDNDLIAKSGGEWKRLCDLAEMRPFFEAARAARNRHDITQPVAAGFARAAASEHAATIRDVPMARVSAPAQAQQQPVQHVTAAYAAEPATPQAPMARPAVPAVSQATPTVRAPQTPMTSSAFSAATQPAMQAPRVPAAHESADTIQAFVPAASQVPPAPFAATPVSDNAPTMRQIPGAASFAPTMPAGSVAPAAPHVPPAQPASAFQTQGGYQVGVPAPTPAEPDLSQIPASAQEERWVQGRQVAASGPAWAEAASAPGAAVRPDYDEDDLPAPRRHVVRWIALALMVLLIGGGFYVFMFQRDLVEGLLGGLAGGLAGGQAEDRHLTFFTKGQESFLLDTDLSFLQADRDFHTALSVIERDPATLAALTKMYAAWTQYLRDEEIDARVDARARAGEGEEPDGREAARLEREAGTKLDEARRNAKLAKEAGSDLRAIQVALADMARLEGRLDEAEKLLARIPEEAFDPGARYVKALIAIDRDKPADEVLDLLAAPSKGDELLRAIYRRARVLAAAGRNAEAQEAIKKVIALNRDHQRARALEERIAAGSLVALRLEVDATEAEAEAAGDEGAEKAADEPTPTVAKAAPDKPIAAAAEGGAGVGTGGSVEALLGRASRLQQSGQTAQAMELFEAVLKREPNNIDAVSGMGYCYLDRGNRGQAITWFRRALGGGGGSFGPAIIGLAETYKSQGQRAEAVKWYRRYLEVHPGGRDAALARANIERLERELAKEGALADPEKPAVAPDDKVAPAVEPAPASPPAEKPYGDDLAPPKPEEKPAAPAPAAAPDPYPAEG